MNSRKIEIERNYLIIRREFNAAELMKNFPPQIHSNNKKIVFEIACPPGCIHQGKLIFSKWSQISWSDIVLTSIDRTTHNLMEENIYQYKPSELAHINTVEWYINFADRNLFGYYGGGLFAQDEMQVAEHPILASLRECLRTLEREDSRLGAYTKDEHSNPTPVLIRGAERRVQISVDPNAEKGRPFGLYGNRFRNAKKDAVRNATSPLTPPTISNIIAMEAPKYGIGAYSLKEITEIFNTAYTAFLGAKIESYHQIGAKPHVIIHTGNWGTGVYGGNKTIMYILQLLSARVAGVDYLVYHTFDSASSKKYREAIDILKTELIPKGEEVKLITILHDVNKMGFEWGFSDGN